MNPLIQLKTTPPLLIILMLLWFTLLPQVQATPDPGSVDPFNTADGDHALFSNTTGFANAAFGWYALFANTDGLYNTAVGAGALDLNNGNDNTAVGTAALLLNTTGVDNTAVGVAALENNSGDSNTANGAFALFSNITGFDNIALGWEALYSNTEGSNNTAVGLNALFSNTASNNTAVGLNALLDDTTGDRNTAVGVSALQQNISGITNTAVGYQALLSDNTGGGNTAIGSDALASASGNANIAIGYEAGSAVTSADSVIAIGTPGANVSNSCYIGGIAGQTVGAGGTTCYVDNDGKLGVFLSARRFKTDIADMGNPGEALVALRPVTFHYKHELDKTGIPQFGLVAEEVARLDPDLVTHNAKGELSTVRYEAVNAMLLNEFLKEHQTVQELKSAAVKQEAMIASQQKQIEALTAGLRKVSVQLKLNKASPQTVLNNR